MSDSNQPNPPPTGDETPKIDAYYDSSRKHYLVEDAEGNWMTVDKQAILHRLALVGVRPKPAKDEWVTPGDKQVITIQQKRNVAYSGPLAGFKKGIHWINGFKILVTHSPKLVMPKEGEWPTLKALIENQLDAEQRLYWHSWLKLSLEQLIECIEFGRVTYGQVMILAGPRGCGKSLLQLLITEVLGGRSGSPFAFMVKDTPFNRELFGYEHQKIEDEQPHKDMKSRVRFGDALKQVTATVTHPCFGKNRDGLTLTPYWRASLSVNDEPDHLEVLPPFEDSLADKVILLHCKKAEMPMPAGTGAEKAAFWAQLMSELPAYLHWLLNVFTIPTEITDPTRYGVKAYLSPHIMVQLADLQPEIRLLSLIDQILFMDGLPEWEGSAEELIYRLHNDNKYAPQAKHLVSGGIYCGRLLSKLSRLKKPRVTEKRTAHDRDWLIKAPAEPPSPARMSPTITNLTDTIIQ
jgi:hypothetical protein